jgi:hypothetical protein
VHFCLWWLPICALEGREAKYDLRVGYSIACGRSAGGLVDVVGETRHLVP